MEAVCRFTECLQSLFCFLIFRPADQHTVRLRAAAPHAPAQLVQLAEAEALGVFNDHQCRVRHVHADLHDRRGDENVGFSRAERAQRCVLFRALHPPVHQPDAKIGEYLLAQRLRPAFGGFYGVFFAAFHGGADDIDLMPFRALLPNEDVQPLTQRFADKKCLDWLPARRQFGNHRYIQIAVGDEGQRARDGRGGHDEQMRRIPLFREPCALRDAEAMLFVSHDEAERLKLHAGADQRVCSDDQLRFAGSNLFPCGTFLRRGL